MKQITTNVLGFEVPVTGVPENLAEAVTSAGGEQNLTDQWIGYRKAHDTNGEARELVVESIAKVTGITRDSKTVKSPTKADPNREVEEFTESEAEYVKRALAESGKTAEQLASQVTSGLSVEFRGQGTARVGGPGKMAKVYTEAAQQVIGAGEAQYNATIGMLEQSNPGISVARDANGAPVLESLAAALKANLKRVQDEANAALGIKAA